MGVAADGVEHHVHLLGDLFEPGPGVINELVGAQFRHDAGVDRRGGGDHPRAPGLGQLHREAAYPASGGVDQHDLTGLQLGRVHQRLPGGQCGERYGGGMNKIQRSRF